MTDKQLVSLVKTFFVYVFIAMFLYCIFAFVLLEMNPLKWSEGARFALAFIFSLSAIFSPVIFLEIDE